MSDSATVDEVQLRRVAGFGGILFVVLSAVFVFCAPLWPPAGASTEAIRTYFEGHRTGFLIGNWVAAVALLPSLGQLGALGVLMKRREGEGGWRWISALVSSGIAHAVGIVVLMVFQATPFLATSGAAELARVTSEIANIGFGFFLIPLAGSALFVGLAFAATQLVPQWLGWAGVPVAALCLAASLGAIWPVGALAAGGLATIATFNVFCIWILVTSIWILRG